MFTRIACLVLTTIATTLIGTAIARVIINRRFARMNKQDLSDLDAAWAAADAAGIDPTI